jgi:hypothetical protein
LRKLHLVGLTTDRDGLIFTARKGSKSGGYIVPLDDKVLAAIAEARSEGNGSPALAEAVDVEAVPKRLRSESALTPREMQARLRGGRSIEEVAAEAGVDTEWVARFAVPILAEQAQVVELARALVYAKPRLGESSQPLGVSVLMNLSDRGIFLPDDIAKAGWSAFQLHDSVWMVRFRYRSRGREQEAQWEIDVPTGRLLARNRHASDLGYVEHGRRRREVESDPEEGEAQEEAPPPKSRRPRAGRGATRAKAAPKRATRVKRPAPAPAPVKARARRAPAVPAKSAAKVTKATTKAATKATRATGRKAAPVRATKGLAPTKKAAPAPVKSAAKSAPAKSASRRRPAKAAPGADAGPTAGSGSVRMAVAQVSTARVRESMAAADRAPWAAAVRRPPGAAHNRAPRVGDGDGSSSRPTGRRPAERDEQPPVSTFQPRPLPPPGSEPVERRVRKVAVPKRSPSSDGTPAVSLPAPRKAGARQEPMPLERPKRRRLRSR